MATSVMRVLTRLVFVMSVAWASAASAADATLFRIFLRDGGVLVSYGEFSRVDDRVVFSMPVGGGTAEPRLQVVWLSADAVDWPRTDKYAASTRYQHYASTRGEVDFQALNDDVARVLNEIAVTTDQKRAMELANRARHALLDWPRTHQGYRQDDVREIVGLIDEAIVGLQAASNRSSFEIALVASIPPVDIEPILGLPTIAEQLDQLVRLASLTTQSAERLSLLQTARAVLEEGGVAVFPNIATQRQALDQRIRGELNVERRYAQLSKRLAAASLREASRARVNAVERVLASIDGEDERLGRLRPDVVASLRAAVTANLAAARDLRLRRDQWMIRQRIYQDYQRQMGTQIVVLVKARSMLEAIRRLDGPRIEALETLRSRLSGGAQRLERMPVAADVRGIHDLVVGAWQFADNAARQRAEAVVSGNMGRAWEASSAAAGSLMMLTRAQQGIRELLDPPKLQ
jgi:hypothetical protein